MHESYPAEIIDQIVNDHFDELCTVRQHLHAHPELSWEELETTQYLSGVLSSHQLPTNRGPRDRGLIVDLSFGGAATDSPRIAVRGDIDAIPVTEETGLPFASTRPGVMHACGHDAHATILLGTLVVLNEMGKRGLIRDDLLVRGLFQPAEEVAQGAKAVMAEGWLDDFHAIFGYHVDPSREVGRVGLKVGVQTAFCDEVAISIKGKGGHSARPHETDDPVFAAVQLVNALYGQLPRKIDSRNPVVLALCKITSGSSTNVIPQSVDIGGTLRALDFDSRERARDTIRRVVDGMQITTGTEINLVLRDKVPGVVNDAELMELVNQASLDVVGANAIDMIPASIGGEDFAFYTQVVPGAFTRIGCGSPKVGYWDLHSPRFSIDPETIRIGVQIMVRSILGWRKSQNTKKRAAANSAPQPPSDT